jgi:hypothetical protein
MMARAILAGALALALLAGCSGGAKSEDTVLGVHGPTVDHVRGGRPGSDADGVLRPEPGNIWSEGLTPSQPVPNR